MTQTALPARYREDWHGSLPIADVPAAFRGRPEDETRRSFHDALVAHFEAMREIGEPIPEPSSSVDYVEVAA